MHVLKMSSTFPTYLEASTEGQTITQHDGEEHQVAMEGVGPLVELCQGWWHVSKLH